MAYVIGVVLALGVALFARRVGLDRDRAFYPTVMIVIASYYVLFAAMGGSGHAVFLESIVMAGFATAAIVGFKRSEWVIVAALAGHGVFDALRGNVIENPGVPAWWPPFCLAFDVVAAACLAWIIVRQRDRPAIEFTIHSSSTARSLAPVRPAGAGKRTIAMRVSQSVRELQPSERDRSRRRLA